MALPRSSGRFLAAIAVLALSSLAMAAAPEPPATTIEISLNPNGIQVPPQVMVDQGETIEWSSTMPFAVDVQRGNQLFGRTLPPQARRGRRGTPVRAAVAGNAPVGRYKYAVAVWDGQNVWVVDPEIVVRPPTE